MVQFNRVEAAMRRYILRNPIKITIFAMSTGAFAFLVPTWNQAKVSSLDQRLTDVCVSVKVAEKERADLKQSSDAAAKELDVAKKERASIIANQDTAQQERAHILAKLDDLEQLFKR